MFKIAFLSSALRELETLPNVEIAKILLKIENLSVNPKPRGAKKLVSNIDLWRIRSGNYRIIYSILKNELIVEIIRIRHRKDAYRKK